MVSFGVNGQLWAKLKWLIFQRFGSAHVLLAAVSVIAAAAQYADLCRWREERDDLRFCLEEANWGKGLLSEKCERIYGDVVLQDSQ